MRNINRSDINRSDINRALAKALAYAECGKFDEAERYGEILIRKLELAAVFKVGSVSVNGERPVLEIGASKAGGR